MSYQFTRPEWPSLKSLQIINVGESVEKRNIPTLLVGMQIDEATMKNSMEAPQKTKIRVVIWSCSPTPGRKSEENYNLKRYIPLNVHNSTIYNSQDMEATYISISRQMNKDVTHTHVYNGILLSHKKEWNNVICSNMGISGDYHTKWSK